MKDEPLQPLSDLLKPLSAKVMPASAKLKQNGGVMSDADATALQRRENARPQRWNTTKFNFGKGLK
jgi:hypothetical protein